LLFFSYWNTIYLMILPVTLSVLILSAMVYMAISRRSSFKVRLAALAALAAMIITVVICLFKIFMGPPAAAKAFSILFTRPPVIFS